VRGRGAESRAAASLKRAGDEQPAKPRITSEGEYPVTSTNGPGGSPSSITTPKGFSMAKLKSLSRGTQIVLVAGPLLFLSLFLTWQNVAVDYGPAGVATLPLDGWDAWGLLLGLLVLSTLTLVVLTNLTDVEMSGDVPWTKVTLGLGVATFVIAVLKNLTDAGSSWSSYLFVALAGGVAMGTYLEWTAARKDRKPLLAAQKRRGIRSTA
jgi:hypothetical protein